MLEEQGKLASSDRSRNTCLSSLLCGRPSRSATSSIIRADSRLYELMTAAGWNDGDVVTVEQSTRS